VKSAVKILCGIAAASVLVALSVMCGTRFYTPAELLDILSSDRSSPAFSVIVNLRVPRILMTLAVGASLSVSGTVFQAILKNPLADPYLIGVSSGAACGAAIAIVLSLDYVWIMVFSFIGSLAVIFVVFLLSKRLKLGSTPLILSGVALGFILSSTVLLIFAVSRAEKVHQAVMWLMGDFSIARYDMLPLMGVLSILLIGLVFCYRKHLDVISIGELYAHNLGITPFSVRVLFWSAAFLAALSVSLCGVVGFVGLIVPHVARKAVGPLHAVLIPSAAIGGAFFLMAADTLGRSLAVPYEIPVGIVTGFAGGLFFLFFIAGGREYA